MEWNPGPKYRKYLNKIDEILGEEQRTVRDVYYALEARGFPKELRNINPDWEFEYRYVKRAVKKGRRAGYIDPGLIVDSSRRAEATVESTGAPPDDWLRDRISYIRTGYHENFWNDQDTYVEVWLEKQSLASVFEPICDEYNVRLEATRGDWSDSKVYETCNRLGAEIADGDDVRILYFGDYNPSGLHAPVAIQNTMAHYGIELDFRDRDDKPESWYFDCWPLDGPVTFSVIEDDGERSDAGSLKMERVALTLDDIKRYDLPENPTPSSTDKDKNLKERFMAHASGGRDVNIELNALKEYHRDELESMLRAAIEQHIDNDLRHETQKRVQRRQGAIQDAVEVDYSVLDGV